MCIYNYILIGLTLDKEFYLLVNELCHFGFNSLSGFFAILDSNYLFFSLSIPKTVSLSLYFFLSFLVKPDLLFYSLLIQYILDIIFIVTL